MIPMLLKFRDVFSFARASLCVALLSTAGCQTLRDRFTSDSKDELKPLPTAMANRLDRLLHQVQYANGTTLLAQLREISAFGSYATEPVIERILASNDPKQRAGAVFVLGEIDRLDGDSVAREAVTKALSDSDRAVRMEAARALLESGDQRAADILVSALDDAERGVRIRAFLSLQSAAGERYDYHPDAPSEARRVAAERFRNHFATTNVEKITAPEFEPATVLPSPDVVNETEG
jgi:HEAT repeats